MESWILLLPLLVTVSSFCKAFERGASFQVIQTFPFCLCWANEHWNKKLNGRGTDCCSTRHIQQKTESVISGSSPLRSAIRATCASMQAIFWFYRVSQTP